MKYIFITFSGLGLPIAYKLQQQGYEVQVGMVQNIKDYVLEEEIESAHENDDDIKHRLQLFQGMLSMEPADKVIERMRSIPNPQDYFVFFDENCLYRWVDKIRDLDFHGTFPTKDDFLFEVDRKRAKQFVKEHYPRLDTPEVHEFNNIREGIKFLK